MGESDTTQQSIKTDVTKQPLINSEITNTSLIVRRRTHLTSPDCHPVLAVRVGRLSPFAGPDYHSVWVLRAHRSTHLTGSDYNPVLVGRVGRLSPLAGSDYNPVLVVRIGRSTYLTGPDYNPVLVIMFARLMTVKSGCRRYLFPTDANGHRAKILIHSKIIMMLCNESNTLVSKLTLVEHWLATNPMPCQHTALPKDTPWSFPIT